MGTDSFIDHVETDYINKNIAEEIETRFDTSNYELNCSSMFQYVRKKRLNVTIK